MTVSQTPSPLFRRIVWRGVIVLLWCGVGPRSVEAVDPRFPHERGVEAPMNEQLPTWWPLRIQYLEQERTRLMERISTLPQHLLRPLPDHHGYHSLPDTAIQDSDHSGDELMIEWGFSSQLDAIALVPALLSRVSGTENYAFPRRLRIEIQRRMGDQNDQGVSAPDDTPWGPWIEVVNWQDDDLPNPGMYPVFFQLDGQGMRRIRFTFPPHPDQRFFALGEIYAFRRDYRGRTSDNMAVWRLTKTSARRSLQAAPSWGVSYVNDGVVGFGLPLSETRLGEEDLFVRWPSDATNEEPVQITLDLGRTRYVGRFHFWPGEAPAGMEVPNFGFPGSISIEVSTQSDFSDAAVFSVSNARNEMFYDNLLNVSTGRLQGRYVRITFSNLAQYRGQRVLSLGEIRVSEFEQVWSLNCQIDATGIPEEYRPQLGRLVDGLSRQRQILSESDWIRGLAERKSLDARLAKVEDLLVTARAGWIRMQVQSSVGIALLLILISLGVWWILKRNHNRSLWALRRQITRDLHDDVGGNLGSVALIAERIESDIQDPRLRTELSDLSLFVREATASLRDVVWMVDRHETSLPELVGKLTHRAQRILGSVGMDVQVNQGPVPEQIVSLAKKRQLIMVFKEVIHNCARHSQASRVEFDLRAKGETLRIRFADDGRGFAESDSHDGWGLDSIRKRIQEMDGRFVIRSAPGAGTTLDFEIPLQSIFNGHNNRYRSSN